MGHKHGIGPQSLGASGMNPKSTPCGHSRTMGNYGTPLDATAAQNAAFGPGSKLADKDPQRAAKILEGINAEDSGTNYGTEKKTDVTSPMEFNVFENADPRAAANMMSDMAPTGGGAPAPSAPMGIAPGAQDMARRSGGSIDGAINNSRVSGIGGLLRGKGFLGRKQKLSRRVATGEPMTPAGPTVNSPGGGSGGAIAAAEAAQASADAANSQMDALKEKLSGIRSQLDSLSGMI